MSIYENRYQLFGPVTGGARRAFVSMRPRVASSATSRFVTVGNGAGETATSEGRCSR